MTTLAQYTEAGLLGSRIVGDHRESVIAELCQRLQSAGRIDNAETFSRAVLEHDELAPAVFDGVAFPLAHKGAFKELSFAVGLMPQPIHWGMPHAPLVHTVVLFAVPSSEEKNICPSCWRSPTFLRTEKLLQTCAPASGRKPCWKFLARFVFDSGRRLRHKPVLKTSREESEESEGEQAFSATFADLRMECFCFSSNGHIPSPLTVAKNKSSGILGT